MILNPPPPEQTAEQSAFLQEMHFLTEKLSFHAERCTILQKDVA